MVSPSGWSHRQGGPIQALAAALGELYRLMCGCSVIGHLGHVGIINVAEVAGRRADPLR